MTIIETTCNLCRHSIVFDDNIGPVGSACVNCENRVQIKKCPDCRKWVDIDQYQDCPYCGYDLNPPTKESCPHPPDRIGFQMKGSENDGYYCKDCGASLAVGPPLDESEHDVTENSEVRR